MKITVTTAAKILINTASSIQFTKISLGSGTPTSGYDPSTVNELFNHEMDISISNCSISDNKAIISAQIISSTTSKGFMLKEIALYANIDGNVVLYAYGDMTNDPQFIYPPGSDNVKVMDIKLEVLTNVSDEIVVNPTLPDSLVTQEYLLEILNNLDVKVSFTSNDSLTPAEWEDVPLLENKEKHSSIFNKVSTMFKNVRYLYKLLGTTDISAIGNGTVTGAIDKLNTDTKNRFTTRKLIGSGINCSFNSDGYDFVELVVDIGGYIYSKLIPVSELYSYSQKPRIINVRYDSNHYYSGYYTISAKGMAGIVSTELVGTLNIINTIEIYGIK